MIKQCLHSKKGQEPKELGIKAEGVGDCYTCEYNPEENKNCKKFYEITVTIIDIEK